MSAPTETVAPACSLCFGEGGAFGPCRDCGKRSDAHVAATGRRVKGSEAVNFEDLIDAIDEWAGCEDLPLDSELLPGSTHIIEALPGAKAAFDVWADKYLRVNAWTGREADQAR